MNPDAFIDLGYQARRERRLPEALQYFSQAASLCRRDNPEALARSVTGLGQIERDLGNADAAIRHYEEAAVLYRNLRMPTRLAHTVRHLGDILRENRQAEKARPHYEEALAIYRNEESRADLDLANALRGFALLKEDFGDTAEAQLLWKEVMALYKAVKVQPGVDECEAHLERLAKA